MKNDPILSRLGIARRAGVLSPGSAAVLESIKKNRARLVVIGADISAKTEKELRFHAGQNVPVVRISADTFMITSAIGTKAGVVSVNDDGLASAVLKNIPNNEKEEMPYDD